MAETTKIQFYISNGALAVIDASAPSPHKRGDWVSRAVIEYAAIMGMGIDNQECGTLELLAARLGRIEQRLALMDAKLDRAGVTG